MDGIGWIGFVTIDCADPERLAAWWGDLLGLKVGRAVNRTSNEELAEQLAFSLMAASVGGWRARELSDPKRRRLRVQAGHAGWLRPKRRSSLTPRARYQPGSGQHPPGTAVSRPTVTSRRRLLAATRSDTSSWLRARSR